ncbi:MAG TPA: iron-containing redox enzyme family protein [Acidimicrobiales bacterium]|nr:iron-containing redox enzyme family protein [Acidimicrobiales bacterium]
MPALDLDVAFDRAISGRRLLEHLYYQRWQDGSLTMDDLGAYAGQYRIIERCLPGVLAASAESLGDGTARRLVEANLRDERSPLPHVELFEGFATAVGAKREADATEATRDLVALYESTASLDPVAALSVIGTYELQAAEVAKTKGESLRAHYGLTEGGTEFWDVHADLEQTHAAWTVEALRTLRASPTTVEKFAVMSADAWWAFLDERDDTRSI